MSLYVPVGNIGFNEGPIYSEKFAYCSAVVLDFGKCGAFLAHCLPQLENPLSYDNGAVHSYNFLDWLKAEAEMKGLDIKTARAFVNAGSSEFLEMILEKLEKEGIAIIEANTEGAPESIKPTSCLTLEM